MVIRPAGAIVTAILTAAAVSLPPTALAQPAATAQPPAAAGKRAKPTTPVTYFVGLKRDDKGAAAAVREVSDPGSPKYRQFPDRQTIASQYGASQATIAAVTKVLQKRGLKLTVDGTGVFGSITGPARRFKRWLGVPVTTKSAPTKTNGTRTVYQSNFDGAPPGLKGLITQFVPYWETTAYSPLQVSGGALIGTAMPNIFPQLNTGTSDGCLQGSPLEGSTYAWDQLRTAYGIDQLATPAGSSVRFGIMAFGTGFADASLAAAQACGGMPAVSYQRTPVQGTQGSLPEGAGGGGEGDLDVQVSNAVLPEGTQVSVLESSAYEFELGFLSWAAAFNLPTQPDVLSASYGACESTFAGFLGGQEVPLQEAVLSRLALSGTTVFASAGDDGSSDCFEVNQSQALAVDYPASSPYVVAVGGSQVMVDQDNQRTGEMTWNGTQYPAPFNSPGGGGGGTSILFDRPWWQPESDNPSSKRTVPDLAGHATNLAPAWPLAQGNQISTVGGTSASTPLIAAAFAVIAANERDAGRPPLGPIQPWLYELRAKSPQTFYDIVATTNDVFDKGCCDATPGYDKASGLGAPALNEIASQIPAPGSGS